LMKLSLNALKNWHQNKGAKRRVDISEASIDSPRKSVSERTLTTAGQGSVSSSAGERRGTQSGGGKQKVGVADRSRSVLSG
jgi:hypothetical protein